MKFWGISLSIMFVLCVAAFAQTRESALVEIVAAENSFADMAAEAGTRAAFLAFAADVGLIFTQKPENAKENWTKRPANKSFLDWRPSWADVSDDGILGYTTGPWAFSRTKDQPPTSWGEYFTVWKKQSDGSWKFMVDLGIQHGETGVSKDSWKSPYMGKGSRPKKYPSDIWQSLETKFSGLATKAGAKKAYAKVSSDHIRLLHEGQMPFQGRAASLEAILPNQVSFKALGGGSSGNLAYAYGEYESGSGTATTEKGFYLRIWKLEANNWRITAEVVHLLTP